jgi:uncharacterized protein (TIGR02996 family)
VTEREALLRSIVASPNDDAPRLVYADWLDEHGEPDRAEFIRLTMGAAPVTGPGVARVEQLLARNGDQWRSEAPALHGVKWGNDLRRGFVHQAYLASWTSFVPIRDSLFARVPLDDLAIDAMTTPACRLLASEWRLRRLCSLTLCGNFNGVGVVALVTSPHVRNLETLYLTGVRGWSEPAAITDEAGRALLQTPHLAKLRRLYAAAYPFSSKVKAALRERFPEAVV